MKIFFVSSKKLDFLKGRYILTFCISALAVALLTSQLVSHVKNTTEPAISRTVVPSAFSVTLNVSGKLPAEGVMILVNGEDYAPLKGPSQTVELERSSVIEVFSETDAGFSVSVTPSVGTTVIMDGDTKVCNRGMNYICRSFFAE